MNPGILAFVLETWSGCIQAGWGSDLWLSAVVLWNSASHVSTMLRSNLDLPIIRSLIFYTWKMWQPQKHQTIHLHTIAELQIVVLFWKKSFSYKIHISWTISGHFPPIFSCTSFDIGFIQLLVLVPNWGFFIGTHIVKRQALQGCPRSRFRLPLLSKIILCPCRNLFFFVPNKLPVLLRCYFESPHLLLFYLFIYFFVCSLIVLNVFKWLF